VTQASGVSSIILPEGAKSGPHGIVVLMIMRVGLCQDSKQTIMLDFTGYACVNCRKMENNVWSDAMIYLF
jgi:thiol:disulfide interchange protein DsbD